jgi:formyl-CoA transferase
MIKPLAGTLVVSLDQAVAGPLAARRLADAGARVIKLERPEGDFARHYDNVVRGQCTHFVWLNRGKQSVVADLTKADDRRLFEALVAKADVLLSVVDIATGMHAYEAVLEALIARGRTGEGADIRVSMFDAMMEWMAVPLLYAEYGAPPKRVGLTHPTVAPYGVFATADGVPVLISIQNDREWAVLCRQVLRHPQLASDPRFATNPARAANRAETDGLVADHFATLSMDALAQELAAAQVAFARVNSVADILHHPHLRRVAVASPWGELALPAAPARVAGAAEPGYGPLPGLGQHTEEVRREFLLSD